MKLSIIMPIYNEGSLIEQVILELINVLDFQNYNYEIICINDGSTDNTGKVLDTLHKKNNNLIIINLSRNFGKESALSAGIDYASGDAVIPIDADGQHPPNLIPNMVEMWKKGYEVVLAKRNNRRSEKFLISLVKIIYYRILNFTSEIYIPENVGDFRLMDKSVIEVLKQLRERERFMKGLYAWLGFKNITIDYEVRDRKLDKTKWQFFKLWKFALDGLTSFSVAPLKIWSYLGFLIFLFSILYTFVTLFQYFIYGINVPGYTSLIILILVFGGLQMMILGIIGEYISRIFIETKNRPIYVVRNILDKKLN